MSFIVSLWSAWTTARQRHQPSRSSWRYIIGRGRKIGGRKGGEGRGEKEELEGGELEGREVGGKGEFVGRGSWRGGKLEGRGV